MHTNSRGPDIHKNNTIYGIRPCKVDSLFLINIKIGIEAGGRSLFYFLKQENWKDNDKLERYMEMELTSDRKQV